jgi:hypothetical protein
VRKRIVVGALLGALVLLIAVPLAVAAVGPRDTSKTITTTPGATWMFKMKGTIPGSKVHEMSYRDFAGFAKARPATWTDSTTDPANPATYSGVDLKTLVGIVDDKNSRTFNEALATTAPGYTVRVIGVDGFSHDFASAEVATKNIIVASKVAVGAAPSLALPFGTAKFKTSSNTVGFSPSWPLKLAGADLTSGSMKIGGISLIVLVSAAAPAVQAAAPRDASQSINSTAGATWMFKLKGTIPGSKNREMTYHGFAAVAAANATSWIDNTTDPANPATYTGVDLKTLVGLIDDKDAKTFDEALATTAPGYIVRVVGVDGFSHDFVSADVAAKNIVVASKVGAAGALAKALPFGTAKYKTTGNSVGFSPSWPLKLVGTDLTSGSMKIGGISVIALLPATTTK